MKLKKSIFTLLFLLLIAFVLAGCNQAPNRPEVVVTPTAVEEVEADEPPPTAVPTGVTVLADGVIQLTQPALPLAFETGGSLSTLTVVEGDVVQEGDLIATLADTALQESVATATLQVAQAENSLAQAQADLDQLLNWEPDASQVAQAEANLTAAEVSLANAQSQDAVAGSSATSARVSVDQAERALIDAQEAYDTAYDPGREWELNDPWRSDRLKNEREAAARNLAFAEEQLEVTQANYSLAIAGVNNDTAVSAEANVASAQQALDQALKGPAAAEILAAELRVEQAEISLDQSRLSLEQAEEGLAKANLYAPWSGTILSVETAVGGMVGAGTPIVTLLDTEKISFYTTNLSERDLGQIAVGQTAVITLKSYPNEPVEGTVARIGLQAEGSVGDAATFPVIITFNENELDIRPGMTGRAEIQRGE